MFMFIPLLVGCKRDVATEFVEQISCYSDYSTVDWFEVSEMYYRPNTADWDEATEEKILEDFPYEIAADYWHILQNARCDFHQKSLPLRSKAAESVINALDQTEAMFDTVFVRCVSQEYYMRLFPEVYSKTMKPAINQLIETINDYDNLL